MRIKVPAFEQRNLHRLKITVADIANVRLHFLARRRNGITFDIDTRSVPGLKRKDVCRSLATDTGQCRDSLVKLILKTDLTVGVVVLRSR